MHSLYSSTAHNHVTLDQYSITTSVSSAAWHDACAAGDNANCEACKATSVHTEHLHDCPRPCTACTSTSFITRSTPPSQHIATQHCTNDCHFTPNVPVVPQHSAHCTSPANQNDDPARDLTRYGSLWQTFHSVKSQALEMRELSPPRDVLSCQIRSHNVISVHSDPKLPNMGSVCRYRCSKYKRHIPGQANGLLTPRIRTKSVPNFWRCRWIWLIPGR